MSNPPDSAKNKTGVASTESCQNINSSIADSSGSTESFVEGQQVTLIDTEGRPIKSYVLVKKEETKKSWNIYWILFFVIILPMVIAAKIYFSYPEWISDTPNVYGPVSQHLFKVFSQYDVNKDGFLTPYEFQKAFYDIKAGAIADSVNLTEIEKENFHDDIGKLLLQQDLPLHKETIQLAATLKPVDVNTMKKFQNEDVEKDQDALFHLKGLRTWLHPFITSANFSVSNFSVFLPRPPMNVMSPGATWELVPKVLGGGTAKHLAHYRYLPPIPNGGAEVLLLYLLSMLHKRPFLHMRFPPRGVVACLRAQNEEYYDIMFRLHPEFQLNEPPQFPFWFTPASFIGRIIIKKDGSHIEHFDMHLPSEKKLNIDMEWITINDAPEKENSSSGVKDAHGQEVDIGYVQEMRIRAFRPSAIVGELQTNSAEPVDLESVTWAQEVSVQEAFDILEQEFYPFKKIPYLPFNKSFEKAKSEQKLVHHILLWGALDDQSC